MAAKPLTTEAIALTEKKMDMTLDEIIKMSKKPTTKVNDRQRTSNKIQKPFNTDSVQGKSSMVRRYMDSRSYLRQGALAKRRTNFTNFKDKQFPLAAETAWRAAIAPIRTRLPFNRQRFASWNKPRIGFPLVQRRLDVGDGAGKRLNQANVVSKRRPTLDSLFANMKEQRMRVQQNMTGRVGALDAQQRRDHPQGRHQERSRAQFQQRRGRFGNTGR